MGNKDVDKRVALGLRSGAAVMALAAVQYDSRKMWDCVWEALRQARELEGGSDD